MGKTLFIILICIVQFSHGQNLIPNPSFENVGTLKCGWILNWEEFEDFLDDWIMPTLGTSDAFSTMSPTHCFSSCFSTHQFSYGYQAPHTGDGMASIRTYGDGAHSTPLNYREYLEVELTEPLVVGQEYHAEIYVSLCDSMNVACNNIGMYFSPTVVSNSASADVLPFTPQINEPTIITESLSWVSISGQFIADAPHKYLVIGNFYTHDNTDIEILGYGIQVNNSGSFYFVDDVSVMECFLTTTTSDTAICVGDTIKLVASSTSFNGWSVDTLLDSIISTDLELLVSPAESTTYYAHSDCRTASVNVNTILLDFSGLGQDTILCPGYMLTLDVTADGATYLWQNGSMDHSFEVTQPGEYWVEVSNYCSSTRDSINVRHNTKYFIPTAFSPNADNLNEHFKITWDCPGNISTFNIGIYSRWGEMIFESNDMTFQWDGRTTKGLAPSDTYVYLLNYCIYPGNCSTQKGIITLIR